jgi:hypothetical protein
MASINAAMGFVFPTMATIIRGNITLIQNTAIAIHRVRNLCCRIGDIFLITVALTTALSKESEVSSTHKISTMKTACNHQMIFIELPAPRKNQMMTAIIVKMIDPVKNFLIICA